MKKSFLEKYGPWAFIAGASAGLGEAYAEELAGLGLNLVLAARRREVLETLAKRLESVYKIQTKILVLDLAEERAAGKAADFVKDLDLGLVVYNAALSLIGPFLDQPLEGHLLELAVNCRSPLGFVHSFGNRFGKRGSGGIILMSSLSSAQGSPNVSHYAATKAWNVILAQGLWYEFRRRNVDITACLAGTIDTPNYRDSKPHNNMPGMNPASVAKSAIRSLGKRPSVVPGFGNKAGDVFIRKLFPRKTGINILGSALEAMYGKIK